MAGCFLGPAREPTLRMHVDTSFSKDEVKCIEDAADLWRTQTHGLADPELVYDYDTKNPLEVARRRLSNRLVRWTSENPVLVEYEKELSEEAGYEVTILGQVNGKGIKDPLHNPIEMRLVADRIPDHHKCVLTAVHEFGHVFGLPHATRRTDIMYPSVDVRRTACLKNDDLLMFCFLNDCGNVKVDPCPDDAPEVFPSVKVVMESENAL